VRAAARGTAVAAAFLMRHGAVVLESPDPPPGPPRVTTGLALLVTSSGTTGLPKNVMLPHRSLVANLGQMRHAQKVTVDDVVIAALPLFHVFALQVSLNLALLQGATVVIVPRFELGAFLQAIQDHGVTRAEVVPPMLLALAAGPEVGDYDLSSLRLLTSAAAPLGGELARSCAARVGCPGAGPVPAGAADDAGPARAAHARLPAAWHHQPVRGLQHRRRHGHQRTAPPPPGDRVPQVPGQDRQGGAR
jgi:acyl-CoA synthetase (AMP-forming)/AMP-acid ligase II